MDWTQLTNRRTQLIEAENALHLAIALLELKLKGVQQDLEEVRFLLDNQPELEGFCDATEPRPAPESEVETE